MILLRSELCTTIHVTHKHCTFYGFKGCVEAECECVHTENDPSTSVFEIHVACFSRTNPQEEKHTRLINRRQITFCLWWVPNSEQKFLFIGMMKT